ncbi:hypothetical protein V1520DRAFT_26291 [Lipomyces starkeyi]
MVYVISYRLWVVLMLRCYFAFGVSGLGYDLLLYKMSYYLSFDLDCILHSLCYTSIGQHFLIVYSCFGIRVLINVLFHYHRFIGGI